MPEITGREPAPATIDEGDSCANCGYEAEIGERLVVIEFDDGDHYEEWCQNCAER